MNRKHLVTPLIALLLLASAPLVSGEPVSLPPTAKILDTDLIMHSWPYPAISPDGEWVAYISRGFVCVANLNGEEPRRLHEVPETWTHFLALPENAPFGGSFHALAKSLDHDQYNEMLKRIKQTVFGLQWTVESDGVVFGVLSHDGEKKTSRSDIFYAPLTGEVGVLAHAEWPLTGSGLGGDFRLSRDRRFMVMSSSGRRSRIWDLASNRPRACCYHNLTPSTSSGRWIAIEKDTYELVVLDEDFSVIRRYEEVVAPEEYGSYLHWSPDERFVICQTVIGFDHYSNWEAFRLDLRTMERRTFAGDYSSEKIQFTGNGGEFLRSGMDGEQGFVTGLNQVAAYFKIVPSGDDEPTVLWKIEVSPHQQQEGERLGRAPPIACSPDFQLFTIGLPRQEGTYGTIYHLIDRKGRLWRLSNEDSGEYRSPYEVVGFAKEGEVIVGYDEDRLFTVPVAAVQTPENLATLGR